MLRVLLPTKTFFITGTKASSVTDPERDDKTRHAPGWTSTAHWALRHSLGGQFLRRKVRSQNGANLRKKPRSFTTGAGELRSLQGAILQSPPRHYIRSTAGVFLLLSANCLPL